jgi:hypothetical protein
MPASRHHNEWLSLIDVSGPFLSVPVLDKVFPQGLDAHDPEHARLLKLAFEEWEDNQQGERANSAVHRAWIDFVLKQTLGLPDEVIAEGQETPQTLRVTIAEQGETLRPDGDDERGPDSVAGASDERSGPASHSDQAAPKSARADRQIAPASAANAAPRPVPIDQIETDAVMAGFRQAARRRGSMERDELLKEVSLILGYQRLGPKIDELLRGHLRAAIRRGIIEPDGPALVRAGTGTMLDYGLEALREAFWSVMRQGTSYERGDVIHALARHLGFVRVTDTIREPIKSAIKSAIRQGLLGYEGTVIWREE